MIVVHPLDYPLFKALFEGTLDDLKSRQRARVVVEVDQPAIACSLLRDAGWTVEQVDEPAVRITVNSVQLETPVRFRLFCTRGQRSSDRLPGSGGDRRLRV